MQADKIRTPKKVPTDSTTQRSLPFSEIRDNLIMMKDGSSRMILKVHPINFELKSEEEQDAIILSFQRVLNALRFPIQIVVRSLKIDLAPYLAKLSNRAYAQQNALLQTQTLKYIEFLKNLVEYAQIMRKEFYIVIPFDYEENASVKRSGIQGIFENFWSAITNEESITSIRSNHQRVDKMKKGNMERVSQIKTSLESVGLRSQELTKDEIVKYLISYYNPRLGGDLNPKDMTKIDLK